MQAIDRTAIEVIGIPRVILMEHAGLALANHAIALHPSPGGTILVCAGLGFNGGDGLAAARHLHEAGYAVRIALAGRVAQLREPPRTFAAVLQHLGVPCIEVDSPLAPHDARLAWCSGAALMLDALLGIGAHGPVREPIASLIRAMNAFGAPIISADVPSGLDADSGIVQGTAVRATATVAFGRPKRGCLIGDGPHYAGVLRVEPISLPRTLLEAQDP